jgi:hypothetical protein
LQSYLDRVILRGGQPDIQVPPVALTGNRNMRAQLRASPEHIRVHLLPGGRSVILL